jgi:Protein of unknown function (DUF1559)
MYSGNNLKQIALAMHLYHSTWRSFPPAAVRSPAGQPLYSWRVLLLPCLDEHKLYSEFNLNEAWDSPNNLKLLPRMPKVYEPPLRADTGAPPNSTFYQVFTDGEAAFEKVARLSLADFTDPSLTCLVVEGGRPVLWSKPEDLSYAADQPLPELGGIFKGGSRFSGLAKVDGFHVAFVDGSTRWIRRLHTEQEEVQFRSLIVRKGKKIEPDLLQ